MKFKLPELPFEFNALEPYISRSTLEYHYLKHNQAYITNLNALVSNTKFENKDLETIIKVTEGPIFNNAAQIWNHSFYFEALSPGKNHNPKGPFTDVINENFGSIIFFKNTFLKSVITLFGSGWVWLVLNQKGSLEIIQELNAGNPLRRGITPLLTCDVWEHAYYLDYKNSRSDYAEAFWKLINWDLVEKRYNDAIG